MTKTVGVGLIGSQFISSIHARGRRRLLSVHPAQETPSGLLESSEEWNYGFWDEMRHFVDCVADHRQPLVTGEDGRAVLEVAMAAYESAGTGRKVELPFETDAAKPIDLWKK